MSTVRTPSATQPPVRATPPSTQRAAATDPTAVQFFARYARTLCLPLIGVMTSATGGTVLPAIGWPVVTAAVIGWSLGVAAWLRHHGWPIATAHLAAWAAPTALLAPLIAVGRLSPAGLVLWGPVSALLAIALVAAYDTRVVLLPTRAAVARDCVRHAARD